LGIWREKGGRRRRGTTRADLPVFFEHQYKANPQLIIVILPSRDKVFYEEVKRAASEIIFQFVPKFLEVRTDSSRSFFLSLFLFSVSQSSLLSLSHDLSLWTLSELIPFFLLRFVSGLNSSFRTSS